jgi:transcriptional regulator with XRE-family HTH domain
MKRSVATSTEVREQCRRSLILHHASMASIDRARDRGERQAQKLLRELGTELREARLSAGLSQQHVARVAGLNQSRVSRTERSRRVPARVDELAVHCAALGLRLSIKVYPAGSPVRDRAQLRLLERLRLRLDPRFRWRSEAPVSPESGDLRAWDVQLDGPGSIGIDAETRLHDIQALQRRCETKWRDSGVDRIVLLVGSTRHNRRVLGEHREALRSTFPADTPEVLAALRRGRMPGSNGVVVL